MTKVRPVVDEGLGNSAYLVEVAEGLALVVDPSRDPLPYLRAAAAWDLEIAWDDLAMGVIIQAMAPADWAGVLFTRDPDGDPDSARIEVVRGLGEALVSGQVTPHDFRVSRTTFATRGSHEHWPPPFLEDLLRLGLRAERRLGAPQDIEWAYVGEEIHVLQARPITVQGFRRPDDDGFDSRPVPVATYTPIGVQEMLPGVLPPLLWSINAPLLEEAFRRLFAELGVDVPAASGTYLAIGRFRGRAALNLSVLREAAASMPGGSRAEVERQYLGRALADDADDPAPRRRRLDAVLTGLRSLRVRKRVEDEVELFSEAAHGVVALAMPLHELPTARLLAYRARSGTSRRADTPPRSPRPPAPPRRIEPSR